MKKNRYGVGAGSGAPCRLLACEKTQGLSSLTPPLHGGSFTSGGVVSLCLTVTKRGKRKRNIIKKRFKDSV